MSGPESLAARWSASVFLAATLAVLCALAWAAGTAGGAMGFSERLARGAVWLAVDGICSVSSGMAVGWVLGPGIAVGGHLGLYNLATPLAVWLRVRWLHHHRPGFLGRGWFALFVLLWGVLLGMGIFWVRWLKLVT